MIASSSIVLLIIQIFVNFLLIKFFIFPDFHWFYLFLITKIGNKIMENSNYFWWIKCCLIQLFPNFSEFFPIFPNFFAIFQWTCHEMQVKSRDERNKKNWNSLLLLLLKRGPWFMQMNFRRRLSQRHRWLWRCSIFSTPSRRLQNWKSVGNVHSLQRAEVRRVTQVSHCLYKEIFL